MDPFVNGHLYLPKYTMGYSVQYKFMDPFVNGNLYSPNYYGSLSTLVNYGPIHEWASNLCKLKLHFC